MSSGSQYFLSAKYIGIMGLKSSAIPIKATSLNSDLLLNSVTIIYEDEINTTTFKKM